LLDLKKQHQTALVIVTHDHRLADKCGRSLELLLGQLRDRPG
jgi:predicted ABC-type transport system involved in lysophospholipase L1 biosynthesis ATPase subunit